MAKSIVMGALRAIWSGICGNQKSDPAEARSRGQGMVEYLLVLTVVIATTVGALKVLSDSAADLTNTLANTVQGETDVEDPAG